MIEAVLEVTEVATNITEPPTRFYLLLFPPRTETLGTMFGSSVGDEASLFILLYFIFLLFF